MVAGTAMDTIALVNLGCPKNQIDAETMSGLLAGEGYRIIADPSLASTIIVNTCGFIHEARQESIRQILAMAEYKKIGHCQRLFVTGCLAQRYLQELQTELPEVDGFLGTGNVDKIVQLLLGKSPRPAAPEEYDGKAESGRLFSTFPYAYLKIAEGCNHWCSYCVIPQLRGRLRSKERGQVLAEAEKMALSGIAEIILIAQDTSQYGIDFSGQSQLPELLKSLEEIDKIKRVRLLYCYPDHISDDLIQVIANSEKVLPYLDIPLQHSHPDILASMGRLRKGMDLRGLVENLRQSIPGIALRTTFIVGYPGETDEHFQHLMDFAAWAEFDHLGAFMYSREEGTRAAKIRGQISSRVKRQRFDELMRLQQDIVLRRNANMTGERFSCLIDSVENGEARVRSYREAPEVDSCIILRDVRGYRAGDIVPITCIGFEGYDLVGVID